MHSFSTFGITEQLIPDSRITYFYTVIFSMWYDKF